jgi:hypothetical protein
MPSKNTDPVRLTQQWLNEVVIGLGLCPFAAQPVLERRVRIRACDCESELELLETLHEELTLLEQQPAETLETSLLVIPNMLADFADYNQFLDRADALLAQFGWEGKYQIASFHPQYRFADTPPDAAENLTNRAPFATLHLIREQSLTEALAGVEHPEDIPTRNIERMQQLSPEEKRQYFPWLFTANTR